MRRIQLTSVTCALLALWLSVAADASAADKPWFKYENAYFEVYSDASERKTRRLLEDLENFRAATAQILLFDIPDTAPKTQVIILNSKKEFKELVGESGLGGFVIGVNGIPYIVMPAGGARDMSKMTIRHEFTHILVGYSDKNFPQWFHEGIAEFMSSTDFREKDTKFSIGARTLRELVSGPTVKWDELVSDEFEFHSIERSVKASNAYYQAWQLTHYLFIGEDMRYYKDLGLYLGYYNAGTPSIEAIETVFEMSPQELGRQMEKDYARSTPYYLVEFDDGIRDQDFTRNTYDADVVAASLDLIREEFAARNGDPGGE